ncbi:nickel transport system ATP-binding protein [Paenibacillus phyllosphaerae]|uniref:Nickel transport system ATP-binding protein n=1 Tax=Paenibacillus phyllosphaerae TaxID=274593 RepID=A0A7W5FNR0_9BACL|nr:ABC transporter ATP-binding protein [Paenibacillus phyllosphaerae]MBB3111448.1 nickel transport system ATP-binding protein [Paenibacillus phyllosphaerae]
MLNISHVFKSYSAGGMFARRAQEVVRDVSFACEPGECLGIVGESGSGKSTLGRMIAGLEKPDRGIVHWEGRPVWDRRQRGCRISAVFQDYTSSINPFFTVEEAIMEPLRTSGMHKRKDRSSVDLLLEQVGLNASYRERYPHELSGGEAQRVCIARAIATEPHYIVMDEAVSSLDGSVQLLVLDLLKALRRKYAMSYMFITHDLQAAAYLCDRILFFKEGRVEEIIATEQLRNAQSEYARHLLRMVITS